MINKSRLLKTFLDLININSPSKEERKAGDFVKNTLENLGFDVFEDNAGQIINGNCGNIIASKKGNNKIAPLILNAHIDTVESTENINVIIENSIIKTDGKTILGADDKAGVAAIIEGIHSYFESDMDFGDLQVIFTVSEETGLEGAKNMDFSLINKDSFLFAFDSGKPVCSIVTGAPSHSTMKFEIFGKSAHAGMCPEEGINSIACASKAISTLKFGRIDHETTCNVGIISGGTKSNVVPEYTEVIIEARSRNEEKLNILEEKIINAFEVSAFEMNAKIKNHISREYIAFTHNTSDDICQLAIESARAVGIEPDFEISGGGFDANCFNLAGIKAAAIGTGYENVHSKEEFISICDLEKSAEYVFALIDTMKKY